MAISENELQKEKKILHKVNKLLHSTLDDLGKDVSSAEVELVEFKKMMWSDSHSFDVGEVQQVMAATSLEADKFFQKQNKFFKNIFKILFGINFKFPITSFIIKYIFIIINYILIISIVVIFFTNQTFI